MSKEVSTVYREKMKQRLYQEFSERQKAALDLIKHNKELRKIKRSLPEEKVLDFIAMVFLSTNMKAGYEKVFVDAVMNLKDETIKILQQ